MYCIILIGMPCSGKSTIGKIYASKYGLTYVSTGDIARKLADEDEDVKAQLQDGQMATEYKMRMYISDRINELIDEDTPFILDGCPRNIEQDNWFLAIFKDKLKMIYIEIWAYDQDCASRAIMRGRYDDDTISKRIQYYKENTYNVLHRHSYKRIANIDGYPIEQIIMEVNKYVDNRKV